VAAPAHALHGGAVSVFGRDDAEEGGVGGLTGTTATPPEVGRRSLLIAALSARAVTAHAQATPPSDAAIRAILVERIDIYPLSRGLIAGLRTPDGRRLVTYGTSDTPDGRPLDGDTVFEIGSITKVFTALLLADMVARGEVALDDPVAKYLPVGLPGGVNLARRNGKQITLLDLATYTSGVPNMPDNFAPRDPANPYADYTVAQLYGFLNRYVPRYDPGTHYEYANLGFALLGHALSLRAGRSYEDLVIERICVPLGLDSTRITLSASMRARLAPGHNSSLDPVPNWDLPTLAGAGALRSTANDLFSFLEACLALRETPLAPAFASMLSVRRHAWSEMDVAQGWFVSSRHDDSIVWKNGETGGYSSFIGYSLTNRVASIVLSTTANFRNSDEIGFHLVNAAYPLIKQRRAIAIHPALLAAYVGSYAIRPGFILAITQRDGRLFVTPTYQGTYELFAESESAFFLRVVDAQVTFERSGDGRGTAPALVLHQNGRDLRGERVP